MTYLSTENLSKRYDEDVLFEGLTFGIAKGDKTALVARNGTGKSTLLRILSRKEDPDSGKVMYRNGVRVGYLAQEPVLDEGLTIQGVIEQGNSEKLQIVRRYEKAVQAQAEDFTPDTQKAYEKALAAMETAEAWDFEERMEQILGKLRIHDLTRSVASLSGGERKRVALAFVLLDEPDMLIMDEPTNHLDVEMIEWLEQYLSQSGTTLLMVTHDRYFLDRVCSHIIELDEGKIYHHKGNYSYFLQKRNERLEIEQKLQDKAGQLMKKELEWLRRQPKARGTKAKSRVKSFYDTKEKAESTREEEHLNLQLESKRIGGRVVDMTKISKRYDDQVILDGFTYSFKGGERIGIIGANGVGKSTFINILTGEDQPDTGDVFKGETISFGYYHQQGLRVDESKRAIEAVREVAEVLTFADGSELSASKFMEQFMFPKKKQYTAIKDLSGGQKRRLALMMTLIGNPNFLILDEPTNDLDIFTLNKLEEFLQNFGGCLILVSHDRFFMDKLVDHYFIFEGDGVVRDFNGTYQEYREQLEQEQTDRKAAKKEEEQQRKKQNQNGSSAKQKPKPQPQTGLSQKEQREAEQLEREIEALEQEKSELESQLNNGELEPSEMEEKSARYGAIEQEVETKTERWMELLENE